MRQSIKDVQAREHAGGAVTVTGWVRTRRDSKEVSFIELNDGSTFHSIQIVVGNQSPAFGQLRAAGAGASLEVTGQLIASPGKGQRYEIQADTLRVLGDSDQASYPLQKKGHSYEFLRTIAHLRPRTNTFGAVFRVRSELAFAIHSFFHERGFRYIHPPIITPSDCEGAGEMFRVTTLNMEDPPRVDGKIDYAQDFFGKPTFLTVSGQLEAELLACGLGSVYTFGPTFRSENSNTSRHLAEFWMIEPEMAFYDIHGNMQLAEDFLKSIITHVLTHCPDDMDFFNNRIEPGIIDRLRTVAASEFLRLTYTDAIAILERSGHPFDYPVFWGCDLQSEHERFLTEKHFGQPVILYNYPKEIKAFYMRMNDDGKTVAAMDVLVPGIGEIIGGSQREERYDVLLERIRDKGLSEADYSWYLDIRRFGTVEHSGFGLGFERMMMYVTGMTNIRDVIPFARTPGSAEF